MKWYFESEENEPVEISGHIWPIDYDPENGMFLFKVETKKGGLLDNGKKFNSGKYIIMDEWRVKELLALMGNHNI